MADPVRISIIIIYTRRLPKLEKKVENKIKQIDLVDFLVFKAIL